MISRTVRRGRQWVGVSVLGILTLVSFPSLGVPAPPGPLAITVDARDPSVPVVEIDWDWIAPGPAPSSFFEFFIGPTVDVRAARLATTEVACTREADDASGLARWRLALPAPVAAGDTLPLTLTLAYPEPRAPGLHASPAGG